MKKENIEIQKTLLDIDYQGNTLFPIFIKLHQIDTLVVGGGNVGLEKLEAILRNSPEAKVTLVAGLIREEIKILTASHPRVELIERDFEWADLDNRNLIILATDNKQLHVEIKAKTEVLGILTNVADTPDLCDFYLSSVVKKGDLKVAISTNGKSPTLAKRMRAYLEESLPDDIQELLDNLYDIRNQLKGDFQEKIKQLNHVTKGLKVTSPSQKKKNTFGFIKRLYTFK